MTKSKEARPAAVPARAIRTGKTQDPRFWVAPTIRTERLLTALQQRVKGGQCAAFAEHGLSSLKAAHALACQSSLR